MCGFCGLALTNSSQTPSRSRLEAMTERLTARGPDDVGTFIAPGIALGHRRLKVIDLEGGQQPMSALDGDVVIAYNGEIYNFRELRDELKSLGASFHSRSDTEVLLQGYLTWGLDDMLPKLVGMFAFALWDGRDQALHLCRDRLGVKPLYVADYPDGSLGFASDLNALLADPELPRKLNLEQAARYVALSYVSGPDSLLEGIRQLEPGSLLSWKHDKQPVARRWWDLAELWQQARNDTRSDAAIEEEFAALLRRAVSDRLVSDVPLGVFLSGGLDSSTIAALVRAETPRTETFSIGFSEPSYSELPWARQVAQTLGCTHFDQIVAGDSPELIEEISASQGEPFADTSIVPTYLLSQMARGRVTVALSGDGGDELLAGYVTNQADTWHARLQGVPAPLLRAAQRAVAALPESRRKVNLLFKAKQFLAATGDNACDAHARWRMLAGPAQLAQLFPPDLLSDSETGFSPFRTAFGRVPGLGFLDRFLYVDYTTWLASDILVKTDRASMAHGLEVRSPFLDHRLVEFCMGLPPGAKLRGGRGKYLLRRVAKPLLPPAILRRRKAGFNAPVAHWLTGGWRELAEDVLLNRGGLLDRPTVSRLWNDHGSGRRDQGLLLFTILMLNLWLDRVRPAF